MSRVLVTGATGLIGRYAVAALEASGHEVFASSGRQVDLLEPRAAARLVSEASPELVLHLAWVVEHGRFRTSPANAAWVAASRRLAAAAAGAGARRIVVAGTCEEYDLSLPGPSVVGVTPTRPANEYGRAKLELCESLVADAPALGIEVGWGRIFFLYAHDEHPDRLVASVARALVEGRIAEVSHGRQVRDLLHARDVARGLIHLLTAMPPAVANIGSGRPTTIAEVALLLGDLTGRRDLVRLGARRAPVDEPLEVVADITTLAAAGWAPTTTLEAGLADVVDRLRHQARA